MNLIDKLKNLTIPLIIVGSFIPFSFGNSQTLSSQKKYFWEDKLKNFEYKEEKNKKKVLALITTYDSPLVTKGMEEMLKNNFKNFAEYELHTKRTKSIKEISNSIEEHSKYKSIDAVILAYHGKKYSFEVSESENVDTSNVQKIFEKYKNSFSKDAIIILYSCSAGSGEDNIAKRISDILDKDVVAPKFTLLSETSLETSQRMGEFALDDNGRVNFDFDKFRRYFYLIKIFPNFSIGTHSFHTFKGKAITGEDGRNYFFFSDKETIDNNN
ncbi:MAG: DUF4347 domain-containing protein [Nanoarchaeota archaeon]|nr:DUF4347 domain-containing protein [Nanoarchaeota archaeon]